MAPLYNRYIPPKAPAVAPVVPQATAQPVVQDEPKRKRERSEAEVEERKAKKLRKKGEATDLKTKAKETEPEIEREKPAAPAVPIQPTEEVSEPVGPLVPAPAGGDFSHIKNVKKRHKLEKEARKAKKAAEKEEKDAGAPTDDGRSGGELPVGDDGADDQDMADASNETQIDEIPVPMEAAAAELDAAASKAAAREARDQAKKAKKMAKKQRQADRMVELPDDHAAQAKARSRSRSPAIDDDFQPLDGDYGDSETAKTVQSPRKRRHKLEAVLRGGDESMVDDPPDDDEHLAKHKRMMGKFQKSIKLTQDAPQAPENAEVDDKPKPVLHDLVPLPTAEPIELPEFKPDYSDLPKWLANPTVISSDTQQSFEDMKLPTKTVQQLKALRFESAMPVQQALLPLLLPCGTPGSTFSSGLESILPDIAVSAPTGSGKTLGYLLPIVETLRQQAAGVGKLKALVVVPTRELVQQVGAVAESLTKGSGIKVGMASGGAGFKDEKTRLVETELRYNPNEHAKLMSKVKRRDNPPKEESDEFGEWVAEQENPTAQDTHVLDDARTLLAGHVRSYHSAIDILVCTPGRLLEHMNGTFGFSVAHIQWLVLDEADKLLDQQYDGFLETLNDAISKPRSENEQDYRERYLRKHGMWDEQRERQVRKVVLSATMTRDVSKLTALELKRPRLVVVRGGEQNGDGDVGMEDGGVKQTGDGFELPPTLAEYCVPVGDGSEKPLYMLELLRSKILATSASTQIRASNGAEVTEPDGSDSDSSSDSDSDSDSDSSSESSSDSDSSASASSSSSSSSTSDNAPDAMDLDTPDAPRSKPTTAPTAPTILIFTSSTETCTRLSHLLRTLIPAWKPFITTLTKSSTKPKPSNAPTNPANPVITIATDRAARGLDLLGSRPVTHVLQYDVPRSVENYVHRVGRTARAGRSGEGWTLYTSSEARWFVKEVTKAEAVARRAGVERVKITVGDEGVREKFVEAVAGMREQVLRNGKGGNGR